MTNVTEMMTVVWHAWQLVVTEQEWTNHRPCCLHGKNSEPVSAIERRKKRLSPSQYCFHYHQALAGEFQPLFRPTIRLCCDRTILLLSPPASGRCRGAVMRDDAGWLHTCIARTCWPMAANTDEYSTILIFMSFNFLIITFSSQTRHIIRVIIIHKHKLEDYPVPFARRQMSKITQCH